MHEVEIHDLNSEGEGVGLLEGKAVFVPFSLPGERVLITVTEEHPRFLRAKLQEKLKVSDKRQDPICPLFGECGGCQLMHLSYEGQLLWKQKRVQDALYRIGKIEHKVSPCEPSEKELYYRNKVSLVEGGFCKRKSHSIVPISYCYLQNPLGNKELENRQNVKKLVIRTSSMDQESMLIKDGKANKPFFKEKLGPFIFKIAPDAFFQVNIKQAEKLYIAAVKEADLKPTETVVDAYCGVGALSLFLAQRAKELIGIEFGRKAIQSAKENAKENKLTNTRFICGAVEEKLKNLKQIDCLVINPPRGGVDNRVLLEIKRLKPKKLIYISCNPATLSRDLKALKDGYQILSVRPFDLFPQTVHVETLVSLKRKMD